MTLSGMRQVLETRGIQLTKSLGQNFLHDTRQLDRITAAAQLGGDDRVLEIGPGLGPLTERLTAAAGLVLAIEKDARLVRVLEDHFKSADRRILPRSCAVIPVPGCTSCRPMPWRFSSGMLRTCRTGSWSPTCPTRWRRRSWLS